MSTCFRMIIELCKSFERLVYTSALLLYSIFLQEYILKNWTKLIWNFAESVFFLDGQKFPPEICASTSFLGRSYMCFQPFLQWLLFKLSCTLKLLLTELFSSGQSLHGWEIKQHQEMYCIQSQVKVKIIFIVSLAIYSVHIMD